MWNLFILVRQENLISVLDFEGIKSFLFKDQTVQETNCSPFNFKLKEIHSILQESFKQQEQLKKMSKSAWYGTTAKVSREKEAAWSKESRMETWWATVFAEEITLPCGTGKKKGVASAVSVSLNCHIYDYNTWSATIWLQLDLETSCRYCWDKQQYSCGGMWLSIGEVCSEASGQLLAVDRKPTKWEVLLPIPS